jgi:signal transduction histidine kinase/CheY-like chemotaxis protein
MNRAADMNFAERYEDALGSFLKVGGEKAREAAYELGRSALEQGLGLMGLLSLHGKIMAKLPENAGPAGMDFLAEAAAPLEMELRGYQEANASLRQMNQLLETKVEQRTHSLKQAEERFFQAQKLDGIGRLAGGVAHDFNNLLTVINGYADLSLESLQPGDLIHENMKNIAKAGNRAASLTRQLLAFSRKQMIAPRILDLNAVVGDMEKMLLRLIPENIRLKFVAGKPLAPILADPGQMEQIIMNLAVNARDAMPNGGQLTLETSNVSLDANSLKAHPDCPPGVYVLLSVSDTGSGMDAKIRDRLFEPFFTTKEPGKGTGLGLATVYGIVRQSGGLIWVYSEPGKGSTFKVYFPGTNPSTETGAIAAVEQMEILRGSERLMVVEDDDEVRRLTCGVLKTAGYLVMEASGPKQALRLLDECEAPHLLITDLVMPDMNGRELAECMQERQPGLKVLFLSGYAGGAATAQGMLEPGRDFLEKPYAPALLAKKVREILDGEA